MEMRIGRAALLLVAVFVLSSCGGGGGGSDGGGTGTLSLSMTDAANDQFQAVYVTIDEIQIHLGGNDGDPKSWETLTMERHPITVDLTKLTNGVREQLGIVDLPAGDYTQVRLIIGETPEDPNLPFANYVVDSNTPPNIHEMKIPSGTNTGFKIVENFTIETGTTLELVLDFDASRSVIQAGSSGQWLLKPTVKIENLADASIVSGQVTEAADGTTAIPGALVSAQQYDGSPDLTDEKNRVLVQASTITDENGEYALFLKPGTYNVVATYEGKEPFDAKAPEIIKITTEAATTPTVADFQLPDPVDGVGEITGKVVINADSENYATLSFRQEAGTEMIEVGSRNVANGGTYTISLPVGTYTIVASSFGFPTKSDLEVEVTKDTQTTLNINF
jgi:hypothetical protein